MTRLAAAVLVVAGVLAVAVVVAYVVTVILDDLLGFRW